MSLIQSLHRYVRKLQEASLLSDFDELFIDMERAMEQHVHLQSRGYQMA